MDGYKVNSLVGLMLVDLLCLFNPHLSTLNFLSKDKHMHSKTSHF